MKNAIGSIIPILLIHVACCGGILLLLISSGYLLKLSNESQNKWLLVPSLLALFLAGKQLKKRNPNNPPHKSQEKIWRTLMLIIIYLLVSFLFITYLFIPWWIPGYSGGPLLL